MPASKKLNYARYTVAAVELLGQLIQAERKSRHMTAQELSSRLGVDRSTVQRLERGDPKVAVGIVFEACALLGIRLFDEDAAGLAERNADATKWLTLLPKAARSKRVTVDDDF